MCHSIYYTYKTDITLTYDLRVYIPFQDTWGEEDEEMSIVRIDKQVGSKILLR
jgi:hypothetical protein